MFYNLISRAPPSKNWGSPVFVLPRKDGRCRLICDMRDVNKCIRENPKCSMVDCQSHLRNIASKAKLISVIDISNMFYSFEFSDKVKDSGYSQILTEFGAFIQNSANTGCSIVPTHSQQYLFKKIFVDGDQNRRRRA